MGYHRSTECAIDAEVLCAQGFKQISRKHKMIAALEPGWEEKCCKELRSADADFYRRVLSKNVISGVNESIMMQLRKLGAVS